MGGVNNELKTYEQTLKGEKMKLASHVLVLMARWLCYMYASFPQTRGSLEEGCGT